MKKLVSVFIALFLLIGCTFTLSSAYQSVNYHMATDNLSFFSYGTGAYMLNYQGGECHVEKLAPEARGADLHLNRTISAAAVFPNDLAVILCFDTDNDQTEVYIYHIDTDILESYSINDCRFADHRGYYSDNNSIFLVPSSRANVIEEYSISGKLLQSYRFTNDVKQIGADFDGKVLAVSDGAIYRLTGERFTASGGTSVTAPVTFGKEQLITDPSGRILEQSGDTIRLLLKTNSDYGKQYTCRIGDTIYHSEGNEIIGYDITDGTEVSKAVLSGAIVGLYTENGYVCALCKDEQSTISRIHPDEFTDLRTPDIGEEQDDNPLHSEKHPGRITSSIYRIDYDSYSISGIESGTTLAQFKKGIDYDGYQVTFYRDGVLKKSGQCGTAMTAVFENDQAEYTFELSVIGDITGEGNVNSRDLSLLMEYLIGTASFNGVYITSADLSGDGALDVKDLALMHRMY